MNSYPTNSFFDEKSSSFPGDDLSSFHCPDLFPSEISDAGRVRNIGCKRRKSENAEASSSSSSSCYYALHHDPNSSGPLDTRPGPPVQQQQQQQQHRRVANLRERDRAHSVNSAFTTLRALIPTEPADRKLSKIETIRLATSYISHLQTVLVAGSDCVEQPCMRARRALVGTVLTAAKEASPEEEEDDYRETTASLAPICTFCLSASKTKTKTMNANRSEVMPSSRDYVYDWITA